MDLIKGLPEAAQKKLELKTQPTWIDPMLATLTTERFSREGWIFEPKLDGERCLAFKHKTEVRLMSRNEKSITGSYPELVAAISKQTITDFTVDGEIVTFDKGLTSFQRLQSRMQVDNPNQALLQTTPVYYYIFDLLYLDGYDTTHLELRYRKELLQRAIAFNSPLHFTDHIEKEGETYFRKACEKGWEGIIAKKADSIYVSRRSKDWLKFKCINRQEFVIGGYTDPQGQRTGFGALLVGYYQGDQLIYAGKVGTGYNEMSLTQLHKELINIERDSSPFSDAVKEKGIHWVAPKLVCEVTFTEWTDAGMLRHPSFLGLRNDKSAKSVTKE